MHSSSMSEMIFLFVLALVVVGPKRLPGLARQMGKFMAEFKRASNEFKNQFETEIMNIELEERAKKQPESPKVLPPEESRQPPFAPAAGVVGRGSPDQISGPEPQLAVTPGPLPPHDPPVPAKPASTDA